MSDSHLTPGAEAIESNWGAVRRLAADGAFDLTIHLGDLSLDGVSDPGDLRHAHESTRDWPTPIRFLPGNHDIGDNPWAPGMANEHPLSPERLSEFRARFGADYWTVEAEGWSVIGLNAQLFGTESGEEAEQWNWLETAVAAAAGRPTALLLHKPLFQNSPADAAPHIRYVPIAPRLRLLTLLAPLDVRLVASGHTHQHRDRSLRGVRHVWVPSNAFVFPDSMQERIGTKVTGVGLLDLTAGHYRFELIRDPGIRQQDLTECRRPIGLDGSQPPHDG